MVISRRASFIGRFSFVCDSGECVCVCVCVIVECVCDSGECVCVCTTWSEVELLLLNSLY